MNTGKPKHKLFVNYRRSDHPDFVERIRDWFVMRYGRDAVFMDFDTIPPFTRFADHIRDRVREADVLVAIIGPDWLDQFKERLNSGDEDFVRTEIRLALEEGKLIAPICIKGAQPPHPHDLTPDLRTMLAYNVAHLDSGRTFMDNIQRIMDAVEEELAELDGLELITQNLQAIPSNFDLREAIAQFQEAADHKDWHTALRYLQQIRASGYVPKFYPIDDYEQEVREAIRRQEAERDYEIIRLMAERAMRLQTDFERVWGALQMFWEMYPGYDPDDIATQFRQMYLAREVVADKPAPPTPPRPAPAAEQSPELDPAILDNLDTIHDEAADVLFELSTLAQIAREVEAEVNPQSDKLSWDEAQQRGLLKS